MLISHSCKFIFIHVPKAAGSSICNALVPHIHYNLQLQGELRDSWIELFEKVKDIPSHDLLKNDDKFRIEILLRQFRRVNRDEFGALYKDSSPGMFSKLLKSYLEDTYPKIYSRPFVHNKAHEIRDEIPRGIFDEYFKFIVVRNPFDWIVSFYHGSQQIEGPIQADAQKYGTFEKFVNFMYACKSEGRSNEILGGRPWETMADYAFDKEDNCLVDFIGRYESLESDFEELSDKLGMEIKLPHVNASRHESYLSYYTDDLFEKVKYILERDFTLFEYQGIES